ncbi:c-type cytochrome domain-containing protein [Stratiformator vulcanicus]|nr:c-type cytochrome domain-containing protein [Stratiformator vulcanicus]
MRRLTLVTIAVVLTLTAFAPLQAALTREQSREIRTIGRNVGKASSLIRRKEVDEAETLLNDAESKIDQIAKDAELPATHPAVAGIRRAIGIQRNLLARVKASMNPAAEQGPPAAQQGVSFSSDVAPVLTANCTRCHGNGNRGGLKLDTFAGLKAGGQSRQPLVTPGNANGSLIMQRVTRQGRGQMPPNGNRLTAEEVEAISDWINAGAKFDGTDENADFGAMASTGGGTPKEPVKVVIPKPTGNETVSFKEDIAPWMINLCLNCHRGNNPRGGLNLETFENMMRGGDSGIVIHPDKPKEESRLFRLTGGLENPRMPANNQARLTRTNYNNLVKWFEEGNKYDGGDPTTPLRDLVPTAAEKRAMELAKYSPDEFKQHRLEQTEAAWKRSFPDHTANRVETDELLIFGKVPPTRLKELEAAAQSDLDKLREAFGVKQKPMFKGRLAIVVVGDRFDLEEFNLVMEGGRAVPRDVFGHSKVTGDFNDAYVVLLDTGDTAAAGKPDASTTLGTLLTEAVLSRSGNQAPDWATAGAGFAMLNPGQGTENAYLSDMQSLAVEAIKQVARPDDLFKAGQFAPAETKAVSYALGDYLIRAGGANKYATFLSRLSSGVKPEDAAKDVYRVDLTAIGLQFGRTIAQ